MTIQYLPSFNLKYTALELRRLYQAIAFTGACSAILTDIQRPEQESNLIGWSRSKRGHYKYLYIYQHKYA